MYAHEVLTTLPKLFGPVSEEFKNPLNMIAKSIQNSQKFHFGEANVLWKMFYKKSENDKDVFSNPLDKDLRLPYPLCWFDYKTEVNLSDSYTEEEKRKIFEVMKESNFDLSIKKGFLVKEIIPESLLAAICFAEGSKDNGFWSFTPITYLISLGVPISKNKSAAISLMGESEFPVWTNEYKAKDKYIEGWAKAFQTFQGSVYPIPMYDPEKTASLIDPIVVKNDISNLALLEQSIRLLNCRNIITEVVDNVCKIKVGKKVKKIKSKRKFKYHVLNVTIPNSYKKYKSTNKTGKTVRVHLCRGHYKHYTENGLFGKLFGRYWFPEHVRGNKKKGMLIKDYNIKQSS